MSGEWKERAEKAEERLAEIEKAMLDHVVEHQRGAMYPKHNPVCNCVDLCAWAKPLISEATLAEAFGAIP